MGTTPVAPQLFNVNTLGEMSARVSRWARETVDSDIMNDAINDAIESLWMSASLATLSRFVSAPVALSIPQGAQSFSLISIPDPVDYLTSMSMVGGALAARTYSLSYTWVTDSGSETLPSPAYSPDLDPNTWCVVNPPPYHPDAVGWNLYIDNEQGESLLQNVEPLPFNMRWTEPPLGVFSAPNGVRPPVVNTTGDNIFSIERLDIANPSQTLTSWLPTSVASSAFSAYQNHYSLASSHIRHAYDLISNQRVEFRPAAGVNLDATLFFITRPRRLRFSISRLPFTQFTSQAFIFRSALSDVLLSLYEDEASEAWKKRAEEERQRILLSIVNQTWNQNTTVKSYMKG